MTVCIAAICENRNIVGASDRMISSLDLRYEPERPKILPLSSSVVVQYSGDAPTARVVFNEVAEIVANRIRAEPLNWWSVRDVALIWSHYYRRETARQAEDVILAPLGLDLASFLERQRQLAPELVTRLATALQNYKANAVSAIIAGVDTSGPHIFVVRESRVSCEDHLGFAAVGIGDWHATSRFMFSAHANHRSLEATMWLTYNAKRHAEVAPGVGVETDMFAVLGLGGHVAVGPHVLQRMGSIFENSRKAEKRVARRAQEKISEFFATILPPTAPEQTVSPVPLPIDSLPETEPDTAPTEEEPPHA